MKLMMVIRAFIAIYLSQAQMTALSSAECSKFGECTMGHDSTMSFIICGWSRERLYDDAIIGVARICLRGCTFSCQKSWRPFFSRRPVNAPPNLTRPAKTVLKIDSCSGWGCTSCPRGALTHFPSKLRLKKFFSPPWGVQVHPLATPMDAIQNCTREQHVYLFITPDGSYSYTNSNVHSHTETKP